MPTIAENLAAVRARIGQAETQHARTRGSVRLVAVSKTHAATDIAAAADAGQCDFGENYLQEALEKIDALTSRELTWHFIGPIQSNKTRDIATHFDWVHSVDRYKIARRLSEQRPEELGPLNVCLQVNVSGEGSKSGISPVQAPELAAQIADLPRLRLRGLMAIPAPADTFEDQRAPFARLRQLFIEINQTREALDTLSMGMTDDLEAAIAEGADIVRIGTAIFGPRV